jgi:hypothetical protein
MKINENLYESLRLVQNSGKNPGTATRITQNSRLSRESIKALHPIPISSSEYN